VITAYPRRSTRPRWTAAFEVLVYVNMMIKNRQTIAAFETGIAAHPEVVECRRMLAIRKLPGVDLGGRRRRLRAVHMPSLVDLPPPGIGRTTSQFTMKVVKPAESAVTPTRPRRPDTGPNGLTSARGHRLPHPCGGLGRAGAGVPGHHRDGSGRRGAGVRLVLVAQHHTRALFGVLPSPLVLARRRRAAHLDDQARTAVVVARWSSPRRLRRGRRGAGPARRRPTAAGVGAGSDASAAAAFGLEPRVSAPALRRGSRRAVHPVRGREHLPGDRARGAPTGSGVHRVGGRGGRGRRPGDWRHLGAAGRRRGVHGAARPGPLRNRPANDPGGDVPGGAAAASRRRTAGQVAGRPRAAWATELIVQSQPTRAGLAQQLPVMRMLAGELAPALAAVARAPGHGAGLGGLASCRNGVR